jgi:hypothetical protein
VPSFPQDPNFDGARLPIYWAVPRDFEPIKAAKDLLYLDHKVFPSTATASTPGRILAVGGRPPWLCDYFLVHPAAGPERLAVALWWVLEPDHQDDGATTVLDELRAVFGVGVREIPPAELAAEERLAAYQQGLD